VTAGLSSAGVRQLGNTMTRPLRALILADDCNPEWPSLPVVGYKAARAIAEHAEVTVATHVRNRPNIDKVGFGRAKVEYVDNEYVARGLYKLNTWMRGGDQVGWTTNIAMNYPSYLAFEWEVWRRFGPAIKAGQFDVVHRITPMSPTLPSPIARESPVPFILGPLNGGLPWPPGYNEEREREKEWLVKLREAYRYLPFYRSSYEKSAVILAAFNHTLEDLPKSARKRAVNFPEVGIDPELFRAPPERKNDKLTFLFAGRLVPYKLPGLVVECFAQSAELREHRLLIVGDGPEREAMELTIAQHRLHDCVQMLGKKPQAEVAELMRQSDVFVFPSIRELGAGVIVEAMASGLCCVAADYGGPSELLANGRGVKVPLGARGRLSEDFTRELEKVARAPQLAREYGQRGREYALANLTWDIKAQRTVDIYRWAQTRQGPIPTPFAEPQQAGRHAA
jgi:glycosyltransferase involved in cell wall biosynthesis